MHLWLRKLTIEMEKDLPDFISDTRLQRQTETKDTNIKRLNDLKEGDIVVIGELLKNIRDVLTKKNERMVFIEVSDFTQN